MGKSHAARELGRVPRIKRASSFENASNFLSLEHVVNDPSTNGDPLEREPTYPRFPVDL